MKFRRLAVLLLLAFGGLGMTALAISQTTAHVLNRLVDEVLARVFGGASASSSSERSTAFAALPPYPNPYWAMPAIFIDPANTSTCASDTNNGTQATCGGAGTNQGPLSTWNVGLIHNKWGTISPRLAQSTTITFMSDYPNIDAGGSDYPQFTPTIANQADVIVQCTGRGPVVGSGTLNVVTPRAINPAQDLQATFTGTAPTHGGNLVVNTTKGSQAWVEYNPTGSTWALSQPLASATPPLHNVCGFRAQDNTWTSGDAVTIYTQGGCQVPLVNVQPVYETTNSPPTSLVGGTNQLVLWRLVFQDLNLARGTGTEQTLGDHVQVLESAWPNIVNGTTMPLLPNWKAVAQPPLPGLINSYEGAPTGAITWTGVTPFGNRQSGCVFAGSFGNPANTATYLNLSGGTAYGMRLDANFEAQGLASDLWVTGSFIGAMSQWNNADVWLNGPILFNNIGSSLGGYGEGPYLFGTKIPLLEANARVVFNSTDGGTGVWLGPDGGIAINSGETVTGFACTPCPPTATGSNVPTTCAPLTGPDLDKPCDGGGFNGLATLPGGGGVIDGVKYPNNF